MKSRAIIPLVVGLGVGIFAVKLFVDKLQSARGAGQGKETVSVVCTRGDIDAAIEISESMLEIKEVPKALAPSESFEEIESVAGRVSNQPIPRGVPLDAHLLAPEGTPPGMASRIPEGYRAMAVRIDEFSGVAGWVKPGSKVDVVCVLTPRSSSGRTTGQISKVILQNVEVRAVGQEMVTSDSGAEVSRSVTLLVKPKQVTRLILAASKGKLQLALRNPEDEEEHESVATTDNELLNDDAGEAEEGDDEFESLLNGLFAKQPKMDLRQTDKEAEEPKVVTTVASAPQKKGWTVAVITNAGVRAVRFEDDTKNARRVGDDRFGSGGNANAPVSLAAAPQSSVAFEALSDFGGKEGLDSLNSLVELGEMLQSAFGVGGSSPKE